MAPLPFTLRESDRRYPKGTLWLTEDRPLSTVHRLLSNYVFRRKVFFHPHISRCFVCQVQPILVVESLLCHAGPPLRQARWTTA